MQRIQYNKKITLSIILTSILALFVLSHPSIDASKELSELFDKNVLIPSVIYDESIFSETCNIAIKNIFTYNCEDTIGSEKAQQINRICRTDIYKKCNLKYYFFGARNYDQKINYLVNKQFGEILKILISKRINAPNCERVIFEYNIPENTELGKYLSDGYELDEPLGFGSNLYPSRQLDENINILKFLKIKINFKKVNTKDLYGGKTYMTTIEKKLFDDCNENKEIINSYLDKLPKIIYYSEKNKKLWDKVEFLDELNPIKGLFKFKWNEHSEQLKIRNTTVRIINPVIQDLLDLLEEKKKQKNILNNLPRAQGISNEKILSIIS